MPVHRVHFPSWLEFVDAAEFGAPNMPPHKRFSRDHSIDHCSGGDFPANIRNARMGWMEQEDTISAYASSLVAVVSQYIMRPEPIYAYEGIDFDMGRYCDGEPEHWLTFTESESVRTGNHVCRIFANQGAASIVSAETMIKRGAAIAALVRLLDFAGVRSEVTIGSYTEPRSSAPERIYLTVVVKQASEDVDAGIIAYALANPGCFRRLNYSVREQSPAQYIKAFALVTGLYGRSVDLPAYDQSQYDIYIQSLYSCKDWDSPESATAWVLDQLRAQGVILSCSQP